MEIIYKPRRAGKTTEVIKLASKKDAYIVCVSQERLKMVKDMAKKINLSIREPITFDELLREEKIRGKVKRFKFNLVIDNADLFLEFLIGRYSGTLMGISLTKDDESKGVNG